MRVTVSVPRYAAAQAGTFGQALASVGVMNTPDLLLEALGPPLGATEGLAVAHGVLGLVATALGPSELPFVRAAGLTELVKAGGYALQMSHPMAGTAVVALGCLGQALATANSYASWRTPAAVRPPDRTVSVNIPKLAGHAMAAASQIAHDARRSIPHALQTGLGHIGVTVTRDQEPVE